MKKPGPLFMTASGLRPPKSSCSGRLDSGERATNGHGWWSPPQPSNGKPRPSPTPAPVISSTQIIHHVPYHLATGRVVTSSPRRSVEILPYHHRYSAQRVLIPIRIILVHTSRNFQRTFNFSPEAIQLLRVLAQALGNPSDNGYQLTPGAK